MAIIPTIALSVFGVLFVGVCGGIAVMNYLKLKKFTAVELTLVADVSEPLGKVQGKVVADEDNLIRAPFSNVECVGYYLVVEEMQMRMVTETMGNRQVTRMKREWVRVFSHVDAVEFAVKDKSGRADVDLDGVKALDISDREHTETGGLSVGGKAWRRLEDEFDEIARLGNGLEYRATEQLILAGDKLLVFGAVTLKGDNPLFRLNRKKGDKELTVTDRSDSEMAGRYKKFALGFAIAACVLFFVFLGLILLVNVVFKA